MTTPNPSRVPAGVRAGGQFTATTRGESPAGLEVAGTPEAPFEVTYAVHSLVGGSLVADDRAVIVQAADEEAAERAAIAWAHDNDPYADDRIDPRIEVVDVRPLENDAPQADAIHASAAGLLESLPTGEPGSLAGRRRAAAEIAAGHYPNTFPGELTVHAGRLADARAALRATGAAGRTVVLTVGGAIGAQPLEVRAPSVGALRVVNESGFSRLRVIAGTAIVFAESPLGNPIDVEDGATAVVFAAPDRKVSVSVRGSGVAVLVTAPDSRGYQHREDGDGSLDVVRHPDARVTIRTPGRDVIR